MVKNHSKRLAAPKAWPIKRKDNKFIVKPRAGPHSLQTGMPLSTLLKEVFNYANTTREVKNIINTHEIKIDETSRNDHRFPVGIFDTVQFANINEYFRIVLDKQGKLKSVKIKREEASIKPCKIIGKTMANGKLQLNLYDGNNIFVDKNSYKVSDTVILSLPDKNIVRHLKLGKKSTIFLTGGKHIGEVGNIEDIVGNKIIYKDNKGDLIETSKKYAFVVGEGKPLITID